MELHNKCKERVYAKKDIFFVKRGEVYEFINKQLRKKYIRLLKSF